MRCCLEAELRSDVVVVVKAPKHVGWTLTCSSACTKHLFRDTIVVPATAPDSGRLAVVLVGIAVFLVGVVGHLLGLCAGVEAWRFEDEQRG